MCEREGTDMLFVVGVVCVWVVYVYGWCIDTPIPLL